MARFSRPNIDQIRRTPSFISENGNVRSNPRRFNRLKDRTENDPARRIRTGTFSEVVYTQKPDGTIVKTTYGIRVDFRNSQRQRLVPDIRERIVFFPNGTYKQEQFEFRSSASGKSQRRIKVKERTGVSGGGDPSTRFLGGLTQTQKKNRQKRATQTTRIKPSTAQLRRIAESRFRKLGQGATKRVTRSKDGTVTFTSLKGGKYTFDKGFRSREFITNRVGNRVEVTGLTLAQIQKLPALQTTTTVTKRVTSKSKRAKILADANKKAQRARQQALRKGGLKTEPTQSQLRQIRILEKQGYKARTDEGGRVTATRKVGGKTQRVSIDRSGRVKQKLAGTSVDKTSQRFKQFLLGLTEFPRDVAVGFHRNVMAAEITNKQIPKLNKQLTQLFSATRSLIALNKKSVLTQAEKKKQKQKIQEFKKARQQFGGSMRQATNYTSTPEAKLANFVLGLTVIGFTGGAIGGVIGTTTTIGLGAVGAIATGQAAINVLKKPTPKNIGRLAFFLIPTAIAVGKKGLSRSWKPSKANLTKLKAELVRQRSANAKVLQRATREKNIQAARQLKKRQGIINQAIREVNYAISNPVKATTAKAYLKELKKFERSVKKGTHKKSTTKVSLKLDPKISGQLKNALTTVKATTRKVKKTVRKPITRASRARSNLAKRIEVSAKNASKPVRKVLSEAKSVLKRIEFETTFFRLKSKGKITTVSRTARAAIKVAKNRATKKLAPATKIAKDLKLALSKSGIIVQLAKGKARTKLSKLSRKRSLAVKRVEAAVKKQVAAINKPIKEFGVRLKIDINVLRFNTKTAKNFLLGKLKTNLIVLRSRLIDSAGKQTAPVRAALKKVKSQLNSIGISINIKRFNAKVVGRAVKRKVSVKAKTLRTKAQIGTLPIKSAINKRIRAAKKSLERYAININVARFNTKVLAGLPGRAVAKKTTAFISTIRKRLVAGKGTISSQVRKAVAQFNKKSPIKIVVEEVSPSQIISTRLFQKIKPRKSGKVYTFTDLKGRTRTFTRRRDWLKALKRESKFRETVEGKRLLRKKTKASTRTSRVALQRERISLRRQQSIEKKLARGQTLKAQRPVRVTRNGKPVYPFKDKKTGKIRYFTSRKAWLKAVKQQLGRQAPADLAKITRKIRRARKRISRKSQSTARKKRRRLEGRTPEASLRVTRFLDGKSQRLVKTSRGAKIVDAKGRTLFEVVKTSKVQPKIPPNTRQVKSGKSVLLTKTKLRTPKQTANVKSKLIQKKAEIKSKIKKLNASKKRIGQSRFNALRVLLASNLQLVNLLLQAGIITARQTQKLGQKTGLKATTTTVSKTRTSQVSIQSQRARQTTLAAQRAAQSLRRKQILKQRAIQKQKFRTTTRGKKTPPPPKIPDLEKKKRKVNQVISQSIKKQKFIYLPDLAAILLEDVATKAEERRLLKKGRVFTGLEARKIV